VASTLSDGNLTVELTYADIEHLERAVSKATKGFKMKIVNLRPILDFTRNGDVDGYIIENYKLNSEFSRGQYESTSFNSHRRKPAQMD
jgi:hypothetical protein